MRWRRGMGWGVGLGTINFVSLFAGREEEGEGDGAIAIFAGDKSASKSADDDDRGESFGDSESWSVATVATVDGVSRTIMVIDGVSLMTVDGVSLTTVSVTPDRGGLDVPSDSTGEGDGTSCAKVNCIGERERSYVQVARE